MNSFSLWILLGLLLGALGHLLDPSPVKGGLVAAMGVGVVGAVLGGVVASVLFSGAIGGVSLFTLGIVLAVGLLLLLLHHTLFSKQPKF